MSESTDQLDATFEEANLRLNDGLTSCRSVVKDYRAMILGVRAPAKHSGQRRSRARTTEILGD